MDELRLAYLVGRADRLLRGHMEEVLAEVGLTVNELTALSVLAARPGLSNARLARRSLVTPQAMHKVMSSLEARGLVSRTAAEGGGRAMGAFITEVGADLLAEAEVLVGRVEDGFVDLLNADERDSLTRMLLTVCRLD